MRYEKFTKAFFLQPTLAKRDEKWYHFMLIDYIQKEHSQ
jgi:hypothetical protein